MERFIVFFSGIAIMLWSIYELDRTINKSKYEKTRKRRL